MVHPDNEDKTALELIALALKELDAMSERHFDHKPPTLRASIPAQWDDSDVLLYDALRKSKQELESRT